jgi:hypothetical protein
MDFDFTTKAGYQKLFAFVLTMVIEALAVFGVSQAKLDVIVSAAAVAIPIISMIAFFIANQMAASGKAKQEIKKLEIAVANPQVIAPVISAVSIPTVTIPDAPIVEQEVPFNEQAFMDEVNKTVTARYTVANPSTIFYNAEQVYRDWQYDNDNQMKQARALLLKLADAAFKSIWGASYKDAWTYLNDPLARGCPTCPDAQKGCTYPDLKYKARQLGMAYYTTLLDYERIDLIQ